MLAYILCLYKKDVLRGDFGVLQRGCKGAIPKMWNVMWANVAQTDGRERRRGNVYGERSVDGDVI
jgi:hypothetical protein